MKKTVLFSVLLLIAFMAFAAGGGQSGGGGAAASGGPDGYPSRPITMLVGYGPGGVMDMTTRSVTPALEKLIGGTINVVNRPGASGWISYEELSRARPDGYTMAIFVIPGLYGYLDPEAKRTANLDSFQLIGNILTDHTVILVRANDDRFKTIQDLINYAKTHDITVADSGVGSTEDYMLKTVQRDAGVKFGQVPGAGAMEQLPALLGGHVDFMSGSVSEALVYERNGECRTLVMFGPERTPYLPHVPTWNESGFGSQIVFSSQRGFLMPAGADPKLVKFLSDKLIEALGTQEVKDNLERIGMIAAPMSAEQVTADIRRQEAIAKNMVDLVFGSGRNK